MCVRECALLCCVCVCGRHSFPLKDFIKGMDNLMHRAAMGKIVVVVDGGGGSSSGAAAARL